MENLSNKVYEDEIDLIELFKTICKYKVFIFIFTLIVTGISIIYVLSKPNVYEVNVIATKQKIPSMNLVVNNYILEYDVNELLTPLDVAIIKDYSFMKGFLKKNGFDKKLLSEELEKDYVFAFNYNGIYKIFKGKRDKRNKINFFSDIYKPFIQSFLVKKDKKTKLITISYTHPNRFFAYEVINRFLSDASEYLKKKEIAKIENEIKNYKNLLSSTNQNIIKSIIEQKILNLNILKNFVLNSPYYQLNVLVKPIIPDVKDKAGPKRVLIIIISFVSAFILAIFLVFFIEFIKNIKEKWKWKS